MEQSIQKGSVLDDYSCNDKDLWEVKLMTERERSTSGLKWLETGVVNTLERKKTKKATIKANQSMRSLGHLLKLF